MIILPRELLTPKDAHRSIGFQGCTIIESCFYENILKDVAYLSEHELIYIISGQIILKNENKEIHLKRGESVLIKKGAFFEFKKLGKIIGEDYESLLFFINSEFIKEFIQIYGLQNQSHQATKTSMIKLDKSAILDGFMVSLFPYFNELNKKEEEVLRLKTFELLFHLSNTNRHIFDFFFQLTDNSNLSLVRTMETFYTKNMMLEEFAELSGRSLATFKREFKKVFHDTPGKWLKKKRLEYARELLLTTGKKPTSIYLESGFEDYAHFSKSYKQHFGYNPSETI
ncbi:AraC family transcriptional regulator [Croceitalea sp. MTPC5]|nr:AraC family transcriptional regulator [Croceitalea sp. MTPC5]